MNKKAIATTASVLGLVALVWGLDQHWLPREIHEICMADVKQSFIGMQKQVAIQGAQQEEFYWRRREVEMLDALRQDPGNAELRRAYEEARTERMRAEDRVRDLQRK